MSQTSFAEEDDAKSCRQPPELESSLQELEEEEEEDAPALPELKLYRPGITRQLILLIHRTALQWWRGNRQRMLFLAVTALAAALLGAMDGFIYRQQEWQVAAALNLHTCLALLTSIFCLGVFGTERTVFWRESASGLSVLAFFQAKTLVNTIDLFLQCFTFGAFYYVVREPVEPFNHWILPLPLVSFASSGMGYFISTVCPPRHGPFIAALISFVSCGLLGQSNRVLAMQDKGVLEAAMDMFSITRWSVALSFLHFQDHTEKQLELSPGSEKQIFQLHYIYSDRPFPPAFTLGVRSEIFVLIGMGIVWRAAAYLGLCLANRGKRV